MEGEGNDENIRQVDRFAFNILLRAKERSNAIAAVKAKLPVPDRPKTETVQRILDEMESKISSPPGSPQKNVSLSILKPLADNDNSGNTSGILKKAKTVSTFDQMTGNTIVEAKTISDDSDDEEEQQSDEEEMECDQESLGNSSNVDENADAYTEEAEECNDHFDEFAPTGEEETQEKQEDHNLAGITPLVSKTLQKLTEFHSKYEDSIDSPIHPHTPLETLSYAPEETGGGAGAVGGGHVNASKRARVSRLSALAKTINEWEDDTTHHRVPGSRFNEVSKLNNSRASPAGKSKFSSTSPSKSSPGVGSRYTNVSNPNNLRASPVKAKYSPTSPATASPVAAEPKFTDVPKPVNSYISPVKTKMAYASPSFSSPSPATASKFTSDTSKPIPCTSPVGKAKYTTSTPSSPAANGSRFDEASNKTNRPSASTPASVRATSDSPSASPAVKAVSAIRLKFEGGQRRGGASQGLSMNALKPVQKSPPKKKFYFGDREQDQDPSTLSVAQRAKLFESSNFRLAKPSVVEMQPKKPVVCNVERKPVNAPPSTHYGMTGSPGAKTPTSPSKPPRKPTFMPSGCPPPPPPLPSHDPVPTNTSTPTNLHSKRRSTSPVRSFPAESHAVKRIKVNSPKPGRMYPSLTDIETETETEVEGCCSDDESMNDSMESGQSLGAEIENIAKTCSPIRPTVVGGKVPVRYRPSEDFSATFACAAVDALIDEALEGQDVTGTTLDCSTAFFEGAKCPLPVLSEHESDYDTSSAHASEDCTIINDADVDKLANFTPLDQEGCNLEASYSEADTTASSSFTSSPLPKPCSVTPCNVEESSHLLDSCTSAIEQKQDAVRQTPQQDEEPIVPRQLVHTVSFYRKQQKRTDPCPSGLNNIIEQAEINDDSEEEEAPVTVKPDIGQTIRQLEDNVESRNLAIAQASKALNWCKALVGFSDSTEYIECERILLIETQKRLALLNSIHRLKTEGALNRQMPDMFSPSKQEVTPSSKGNMKISDISITLRRDFFNAHRAECQYHFICLVKNKHHIDHTTLLTFDSQKHGSVLRFTNEFILQNLDPDFQVNLEIYYLESAKEFLPHEAKYRINAKKDKHATMLLSPLLTPSKKGAKGDHSKSSIQSPAGPDTIKSSTFKYCGGLSVDISSLQRTYWELDKASGPLTGGVNLKVQCSAMGGMEFKGFLTLFEDVSGFGAWVRRWCRLGPTVLEFWKYPEDETEGKKPPLSTLNLQDCVTSKVRPAPREVCARANTFLLVTTRGPHPNDKDTLVTSCHKGYTAVRHLISADMREERDVWCQHLNKALANLRAWDPVAKQSVDDNLF